MNFIEESKLDGHEIFSTFLIEFGTTIQKGHADPFLIFTADDMVVCLKDGDTVVGFMVYKFNTEFKYTWVNFSWVNPNYRGKDVFKMMNVRVESITKNLGGNMIQSHVHKDNPAAIAANAKVGRDVVYHVTRKMLA